MKTITILLTKYSDFFGRIARGIRDKGYSHASISIDGEETFYSFNYKGFAIEKPKERKPRKQVPGSLCIRMEVPDENYNIMKNEINKFIEEKEKYKFARLGLAMCFIGIPNKFKDKFFCSQFVAEMLTRAGAVKLKKRTSLYMPTHFINGFECLFSKKQLVYNAI